MCLAIPAGTRSVARAGAIVSACLVVLSSGPRSVAHVAAADFAEGGSAGSVIGADTTVVLDWRMMAGLDYRTGERTPLLASLDGREVRVPGFIVPLEDDAGRVSEFLLVPYVGACIHVPPPPPNQLVYVRMGAGRTVEVDWWNPIWIHGRLKIATVPSVYGDVGFQLEGVRSEPYTF